MATISHNSQEVWYHGQTGISQDDAILVSSDDESDDDVSSSDEDFLSARHISTVPGSGIGAELHDDACIHSDFEVLPSSSSDEWPDALEILSRPLTPDRPKSASIKSFQPSPYQLFPRPTNSPVSDIESPQQISPDRAVPASTDVDSRSEAPSNSRFSMIDAARAALSFSRPLYGRNELLPCSASIKPPQHITNQPTSASNTLSSIESQTTPDRLRSTGLESSQRIPDRATSASSTLSSIESQTTPDRLRSTGLESSQRIPDRATSASSTLSSIESQTTPGRPTGALRPGHASAQLEDATPKESIASQDASPPIDPYNKYRNSSPPGNMDSGTYCGTHTEQEHNVIQSQRKRRRPRSDAPADVEADEDGNYGVRRSQRKRRKPSSAMPAPLRVDGTTSLQVPDQPEGESLGTSVAAPNHLLYRCTGMRAE
ncbi:hypothetical protein VM1G_02327 [Cytospora mali]|uniref:Uncharacterized protein n=1 Tax=Cytospora mali TaxID=578113 RepID=A0A194VQ06_CYTMA|nr:hypothetical protein VM1G_02327 [Valsa mali]